ncbi:DNA internalization-related competence protein ComEC/Rec2 [Fictibacillus aquaticus]|uniref:DNA internalization-related competence protein ComEC/Rec2 n=1 Tax=Fictibacillus aquaticus TaxID=2021314 RepID=UPI0013FDCE54|nr:DNA internalization-related competence protein ComEC/Rec2 [Fictibacillus aquaticus]
MRPYVVPLFCVSVIAGVLSYEHHLKTAAFIASAASAVLFWKNVRWLAAALLALPVFYLYSHVYASVVFPTYNTPPHNSYKVLYTVSSAPDIDGDKITFWAADSNDRNRVYVSYKARSEQEVMFFKKLKSGEKCYMRGDLEIPEPKRNEFGMDFPSFLKQNGAAFIMKLKSVPDGCLSPSTSVINSLANARLAGIKHVTSRYPEDASGLLNALLFGDRNGIAPSITKAYQELGLTHLLAVSGYNVAVLIGLIFLLLGTFGMSKERIYVCLLFLIPSYTVLTGGESSIIRAGIMGCAAVFFLLLKRRVTPASIIGTAFILMLFANPFEIYSLGFQLSFYMTFVLICSKKILLLPGSSIIVMLRATLICQLTSLPFILYHFYEISIWSLPLNAVYIPFISLLLFPLTVLIVPLGAMFPALGSFCDVFLIILTEASSDLLQLAAGHTKPFILGRPNIAFLSGYTAASFYLLTYWEQKRKLAPAAFMPFAAVILLHASVPYLRGEARITFLDVGQGDSIVIELPRRDGVYLLDTGGTLNFGSQKEDWKQRKKEFDITEAAVIPALKGMGIRKIDGLILSHSDADHAGGAHLILKEFSVKKLYVPFHTQMVTQLERSILQNAVKKKTEVIRLKKGMTWNVGESLFSVLSPLGTEEESNDQSIVLWSRIESAKFMFTGDIGAEGESRILKQFKAIKANVLKVGHHGSLTSSTEEFLDAVTPDISIISAGRNNRYGHPAPEILQRLNSNHTKVLRTDINGDIRVTVKNGTIITKTMIKKENR